MKTAGGGKKKGPEFSGPFRKPHGTRICSNSCRRSAVALCVGELHILDDLLKIFGKNRASLQFVGKIQRFRQP